MRVFLAIEIPNELRQDIIRLATPLHRAAPQARWLPPENLHVTLHFFGDREEGRVQELVEGLAGAVAAHAPFQARVSVAGSFPPARPRVLWLGLAPSDALKSLHVSVQRRLVKLGESVDRRPFRPHITIARVRGAWQRRHLDQLADALSSLRKRALPIGALSMMRSELGPEGARYQRLATVPLGRDPATKPTKR